MRHPFTPQDAQSATEPWVERLYRNEDEKNDHHINNIAAKGEVVSRVQSVVYVAPDETQLCVDSDEQRGQDNQDGEQNKSLPPSLGEPIEFGERPPSFQKRAIK